ncbi:HAD family hydrolase [Aquimarina litoralis]|uniref:HAD family hydrolase n=1 Tax=Aquimarina litoralis TaxID=584605 RepID=UPI001C58E22B|nr:HAD family hydrolase [Aquimarina litoralis]MBW1295139.1 HAD-IA family hydrolase [Aquimarina litoralis]
MNNIKTIVFDLYNTLIEIQKSNHFFLQLFKSSKNGFGMDITTYSQCVMKNDLDTLKTTFPKEFSMLYTQNSLYLKQELNSVTVYKETIRVLEDLKKHYTLFLISNLASPYKQPFFSNNLHPYFEKVIFSCDFGFLKPNKEIFKEIEKVSGNKPSEILMVGDSLKSDILGAKNMKWNYLKINRQTSLLEKYEIKDLTEIRRHLKPN